MKIQNSSMLDFVRGECDFVSDDDDYTGIFEHDSEEVEAWRQESDTNDDRWRYVNLGPVEVKRRLGSEQDHEEIKALKVAFEFWQANNGYGSQFEAGTVDRGEPRSANYINSMREAVGHERAEHITVRGALSVDVPSISANNGRFLGLDVIDYEFLLDEMNISGIPDGEWY